MFKFPSKRCGKRTSRTSRTSSASLQRRSRIETLEKRNLLAGLVMEDSFFDVNQFEANIVEQVPVDTTGPNGVVGYSYAIVDGDSDNPLAGAGGNRRMQWEDSGEFPAGANQPQEIASISKTVTAAAIMRILQEKVLLANSGLSPEEFGPEEFTNQLQAELNQPIVNYLPSGWGGAANFGSIQVDELLTHSSGLLRQNTPSGTATVTPGLLAAGNSTYDYGGLQQISQSGFVNVPKPTEYWTNNYAWFRVMLPYMWAPISNTALDASAASPIVSMLQLVPNDPALREDLSSAMQQDWGVFPVLGSDILFLSPERVTASIYKFYVSEYILKPSGIASPETKTVGDDFTLLYPLNPTIIPGTNEWPIASDGLPTPSNASGFNTNDQTLNAGSRGWNLSAVEVAQFLTGVRQGATDGTLILTPETLAEMDLRGLGWQHSTNPNYTGDFGQYWGHNGVNFRAPLGQLPGAPNGAFLAHQNNTVAIAFPNEVEAALLFNSQIRSVDSQSPGTTQIVIGAPFNIGSPAASGPAAIGTSTNTTLVNAYDNAWTQLVYEGDAAADADEDDFFVLKVDPSNDQWIQLEHDLQPVLRRRIDTLDRLTIRGLSGNNQYVIEFLPEGLELIIEGGNDRDTVLLGKAATNDMDIVTPGSLTFHGQAGVNSLVVNDTAEMNDGTLFGITNTTLTRGQLPASLLEYSYTNLDALILNASDQDDAIAILTNAVGPSVVVNAAGGNDIVYGGVAADVVNGGDGDDLLLGGGGDDEIRAGNGDDIVDGQRGADSIFGEDGQDNLSGGAGDDRIVGGFGPDSLFGDAGADQLIGGLTGEFDSGQLDLSPDFIDGGRGHDTIAGDNAILDLTNFNVDTSAGGNDMIMGGSGRDLIFGQDGADQIQGNAGSDSIYSMQGSDLVFGGSIVCRDSVRSPRPNQREADARNSASAVRRDSTPRVPRPFVACFGEYEPRVPSNSNPPPAGVVLSAADGSDDIDLGPGRDTGFGDNWSAQFRQHTLGGASDTMIGAAGWDIMFGQVGSDFMHGGSERDQISGGIGGDEIRGGSDNDSLFGDEGADQIFGESGNDQIHGGSGNDKLYGHAGNDIISGGSGRDIASGGEGADTIRGGEGVDNLSGDNGADQIWGDVGDDHLLGGDSNDTLRGGPGRDTIEGQSGDDFLFGAQGNDRILGGAGNDWIFGGSGNDQLRGGPDVDRVNGGSGNDFMRGDDGNDIMSGGSGDDHLQGGQNNDVMDGGAGSDFLQGNAGSDVLRGGDQADTLDGGRGNDMLLGEAGDDVLLGGQGRDIHIGGQDADKLKGGRGEDILVGGITLYDSNDTALTAIHNEWTSNRAYRSRIRNVSGALNPTFVDRLNQNYFLVPAGAAATVLSDVSVDTLLGGADLDWFLPDPFDSTLDDSPGEAITPTAP